MAEEVMNSSDTSPKAPEALQLRARVRPVTRINRKLLLAGGTIFVFGLFAALSVALHPPRALEGSQQTEIFNTTSKRTPDGLTSLPSSYEHWTPETPRLGPPLSGDLGATIVSEEAEWGFTPDWNVNPSTDFRPSEEDEALRARKLEDAKVTDQALKAGLFFDLRNRSSGSNELAPEQASTRTSADLLTLAGLKPGLVEASRISVSNLQDRKAAFVSGEQSTDIYNPHSLETPVSPYQVMAGSLIPAALLTGINSDLPGTIIAQVTQPVYDTISGSVLLIPQGARLLGRYQSEVSFGQDRALIVWDRILFPDGSSLLISEPGADKTGAAGLSDRTDNHWKKVFAAAGLATLLGIGAEFGRDDESGIERALRRGYGDSVSEAGQRVVDRDLAVQPTIRVRPGWPVRVVVTRDLILRPYPDDQH
ncbi:MAG: TrbI/VirB10 family protein [Hyphomonas sp.]|nr:hypothetical protein [Nitrospira sp.]